MKNKVVEYIGNELLHHLLEVDQEAIKLRKYPDFGDPTESGGLDIAVLRERLEKAIKLTELLVK